MPVFCPTDQCVFRNSRKSLTGQGAATVHGVVFHFFALTVPVLKAAGAGNDDFDLDAVPVNVIDGRNLR
ncbi:hypothetical protein [Bradyrhizobium sp. 191]|uniref:hypothetical protein n=1 Tax=Bradyrhizobium sp. 191 TaxID=2782659 RepID=UPI001FFE5867|nr:hypothetical protein [Bradyrhizobium sp. 191]UPJ66491.1 hypothetical protein IVB23_03690 [Bradyrhizobium sp. 191]